MFPYMKSRCRKEMKTFHVNAMIEMFYPGELQEFNVFCFVFLVFT